MIAALGWWTFSLLKYSETEFLMEQKILSSEQRICIEEIATEFEVEYHHENKYFLRTVVSKNEFKLFNEKILSSQLACTLMAHPFSLNIFLKIIQFEEHTPKQ